MLRLNKNCGGNSYELPLFTKAASFAKDHRWNQLPRVLYDSARLPASSLSDTVPLFVYPTQYRYSMVTYYITTREQEHQDDRPTQQSYHRQRASSNYHSHSSGK
jgi:hypothetical protein